MNCRGAASVSLPPAWNRDLGTFFESTLAGLLSPRRPKSNHFALISLSRVSWWFIVDHSGCHPPYILFHDADLEGSRGFEILKFRANRKWEVEGKIGLGSAMLSMVWLIWKRNFSKHSRTPFEEVSFFLVSERILKLRILLSVKNEIFFRSDVHLNRMKLKNVWLKNARI